MLPKQLETYAHVTIDLDAFLQDVGNDDELKAHLTHEGGGEGMLRSIARMDQFRGAVGTVVERMKQLLGTATPNLGQAAGLSMEQLKDFTNGAETLQLLADHVGGLFAETLSRDPDARRELLTTILGDTAAHEKYSEKAVIFWMRKSIAQALAYDWYIDE